MAHWDAIAIGSGLGGLAAAARFARAGKRVLVLERLANFGGAATIYRHDGFSMEASLHALDGDDLTSELGALRRLGIAEAVTPVKVEPFYEVRSKLFARPFRMPHGFDAARAAFAEAFPRSAAAAKHYFDFIASAREGMRRLEEAGHRGPAAVFSLAASAGALIDMAVHSGRTVEKELNALFRDDEAAKLAAAALLLYLDDEPAKSSFLAFAMIAGLYLGGGSFYLKGGSATLTHALLAVIMEAGGEARRRRAVEEILLDDHGRAAGVRARAADGAVEEETADVVFGNASPDALAAMLPETARRVFRHRFEGLEPSISLFTVQLGLSRPAADFGVSSYVTTIYPDWLQRLDQVPVAADVFGGPPGAAMPIYGFADYGGIDAGLRGEGEPYGLGIAGADRLWAWEGYDDDEDKDRRARWIDAFVADLDRHYPGLKGAVVHAEMATARTLRNRLGTPHGEVYGFKPTPKRLFSKPPTPATSIPGLFIASAYTVSGGYSGAMYGGILAAEAALTGLRRS